MDAFRAVAPAIEGFAREHALLIDRYRRAPAATLVQQLASGLATVDRWTVSDLGVPHGPFRAMADEPVGGELSRR